MEKRTVETLKFIKENNGCKAQDVQNHLSVSRPLASSILRSLEELNLIKIEIGEGRAIALSLTERGEEVLKDG